MGESGRDKSRSLELHRNWSKPMLKPERDGTRSLLGDFGLHPKQRAIEDFHQGCTVDMFAENLLAALQRRG